MDDVSGATRRVYHAQHLRLLNDAAALRRHLAMFQKDYFGLGPGWFTGRRVLDAGCGDTAKGAIRYHQFGAREVHGIDLGEDWIYHGVLVHLADVGSAVAAFAELARVTVPGGYLYTVYGLVGGLLEDAVWPALRAYYRGSAEFRAVVDTLAPPVVHAVIRKIVDDMQRHTGETDDRSALFPLLDVDFCVYIQNADATQTLPKMYFDSSSSKSTGASTSRIFPPGGMILSEPPGLILTYFSPISPLVLIEAIESSCSFTPVCRRSFTRAW